MKSDYWYYKLYLSVLKVVHQKPNLADGLDKIWDRQDKPLAERNKALMFILNILEE